MNKTQLDKTLGTIKNYVDKKSYITSRGNTTAESGTTYPAQKGLSMTQAYNNSYPISYGNVMTMYGSGVSQLLIGWSGTSGSHEKAYIRSKRDTNDANYSGWAQIYTSAHPQPSVTGSSGSCTGNAATATKLQTARTINGTSFNGSANITTANWGTARKINGTSVNGSTDVLLPLEYHTCSVGNDNTNLYHHILASGKCASDYTDKSITIMIVGHNSGGCLGIAKCTLRTNQASTGATGHGEINWLVRSNISENQLCYNIRNTAKDTYMDVFYKSNGTYASVTWYVLGEGARGGQSSSTWTKNNTNASGTNAYTEAGMKAIRSYTSTLVSAGTNGVVGNASKAKYDNKDQQIDTTYIKGLSVSGKTITYTKGDGTKGTITTQDTNTTYNTGNASTAGLTKLYTGTGTATDGTMTQAAIKSALDGKAASSHGTHVSYGGNGSASTVSRSDHTHSYLPLAGGTLTGSIKANTLTSTWVDAAKNNKALLNSTATAGNFSPMLNAKTTNGSMVLAYFQTGLQVSYLTKANVDANSNTSSANAILMNESGGASWPGTVSAKTFSENGTTLANKYAPKSHGTHVSYGGNGSATTVSRSDHTHNYAGSGSAGGSANSAVKLATARTINGTSFNGSANITTANWGTARTLTIGNTGKSVNGSRNVSWSLSEIGAAASSHNHGLLHDNFGVTIADTTKDSGWSMINSSYNGYILKSIRTNASAPAWLVNNYGAGVAFGGSDTKGVLSVAYAGPSIRFAGGNGSKPVWYMSLTGSSGKSYNMDSLAAATATKLATARSINGTNFDGTGNITTANWGTARTITIGGKGKSVNGSANVSWTLDEIGAAPKSHGTHVSYGGNGSATTVSRSDHSHNYLPLAGGNMTGAIKSNLTCSHLEGFNGRAIVSSTGSAGSHVAISKTNSTNGYFTLISYQTYMGVTYASKTKVNSGTNSFDYGIRLLDESGNSTLNNIIIENGGESTLKMKCPTNSRNVGLYTNKDNWGVYDYSKDKSIIRYNFDGNRVEVQGNRVVTWDGNNPTHYKLRYGAGMGGANGYITFSY